MDEALPPSETPEKKKKYRRKKTQLEEAFPSYLQVLVSSSQDTLGM